MVEHETMRVDLAGNDDLSRLYPRKPLLSNAAISWGGLYLQ